ncbi:MAG: hypothetical protein KDE22_03255, partial [Rhodobacterales bacterium]|nr:hypothetical protein [Rhodobacterales bacterium]
AARRYRTALAGLPAGTEAAPDPAADLDRALVSKALGLALLASADLSRDTQALDDAVTTLRDVVDRLDRKADGRTWSLAQYRLGQALYRQDLLTDDGDLLRDALNAFQAALTAIDRAKTPVLWADAKTGFARAAQIIGRESRNAEILERAVEACRAALEERNRERAPLPWAATQNNLGSALFLLAHIGGDMALLEDAAQAFTEARDLYQAMGAERQAAIAARNLARARGVPPEADGTGLTGDVASGPDGGQRGAGPAADGAEPKQRQPMWFELEDTAAPDVTRASGSPSPPSPDGAPPEGTP